MAQVISLKSLEDEFADFPSIKQSTRESLIRYRDQRISPGGFLTSVLDNDLQGAVCRADTENLWALKDICLWVNWHLPASSWGDPDRVNAWLSRK